MNNLLYGLKKKNEKLYVEDIEYTEDRKAHAAFIFDRNSAKAYEYLSSARLVKNNLLKNNIETEVIVLRERC